MNIPPRLLNIPNQTLQTIDNRLLEFKKLNSQNNDEWFSELCFCLLTANSKAKTAIAIQKELGVDGFLNKPAEEIAKTIRSHGHRFHNNKAKFIALAREFKNIKEHLSGKNPFEAREFLVKNIKGLGYKEASHFLRNVGYDDVAIIDRHIIRFLVQEKFLKEVPKIINKRIYLECEKILASFAIPQAKLDLMIWVNMTGEVLK
jgi:N-glycosylase/DNA lyase